jgi:hypothetical protein
LGISTSLPLLPPSKPSVHTSIEAVVKNIKTLSEFQILFGVQRQVRQALPPLSSSLLPLLLFVDEERPYPIVGVADDEVGRTSEDGVAEAG